MDRQRRRLLMLFGGVSLSSGCVNLHGHIQDSDDEQPPEPRLQRVGHNPLSDHGLYAQGSITVDGRYGVVGSHKGNGTYLLDLETPESPTTLHHLPSDHGPAFNNLDVKFDPQRRLYYRTVEPAKKETTDGGGGVEIVDFGFDQGTPESPQIIGEIGSSFTHNTCPHPNQPVIYATNNGDGSHGIDVWDVSEPTNAERVGAGWPRGGVHDIVVDPRRERLHCANANGYMILDISDPESPEEMGWFTYDDEPDYTEIGEPGFEAGHYADYDPNRDLAVVGDEVLSGVPGGKHVFDIGWGKGSPEDPEPIGFTHSPNAKRQNDRTSGVWTTHNHDIIPRGDRTFLVSGDYSEGVVLYDITDPTDPHPIDRYETTDGADPDQTASRAPRTWSAEYSTERELVFASDKITGAYTLKLADRD